MAGFAAESCPPEEPRRNNGDPKPPLLLAIKVSLMALPYKAITGWGYAKYKKKRNALRDDAEGEGLVGSLGHKCVAIRENVRDLPFPNVALIS